jgi:thiol-disulfide isomerase/thioredoxin
MLQKKLLNKTQVIKLYNMKRKLILIGLIGLSLAVNAQQKNNYTINGNIVGLKSPYIYIHVSEGSGKPDSVPVRDGKFSYKSSIKEPKRIYISNGKPGFTTNFYVEDAAITITGKISNPESFSVSGGKTQRDLDDFNACLKPSSMAMDKLYKAVNTTKDETAVSHMRKEMDSLYDVYTGSIKAFIISHPKSFVSLDNLIFISYENSYSEMDKCFQNLDASVRNSERGKKLAATILILKRGANGERMSDFTQNDINGKPVTFSSFKGKYVLVDFWASWCVPCRRENPIVLKAYQKFADKGFTVIGVSLDDNAEKWKKAVEMDKMPWTQLSDLKGRNNEVATYYGIGGLPANYLVNPEGIIVARNLRGPELEKKLLELLK